MAEVPIIVLSNTTLDRSVRALGTPLSLQPLFTRLVSGLPIVMAVIGASEAQNAGCIEQQKRCMQYSGISGRQKGWAVRLFEHINATFPNAGHHLYNAGLDATSVLSFSSCLFSHMPSEVHLVVTEWGSMALDNHKHLSSIERIVQIMLQLPSQPVLVHLSSPEWCTQRRTPRAFYSTGDRLMGTIKSFVYPDTPWARVELETTRVCHHYAQPCVSMKEALEPHVLNNEPGFSLHDLTGDDCLHYINGRHGVSYVTQVLSHWFDHAHALWMRSTLRDWQKPPPTQPLHSENEWLQLPTRCYTFTSRSSGQQGFLRLQWCSPMAEVASSKLGRSESKLRNSSCLPKRSAKQPSCPQEIIASVTSLPGKEREKREARSEAVYKAFMASPPSSWVYCPVSLSPEKRKLSDGVVALRPGAVLLTSIDAYLIAGTNETRPHQETTGPAAASATAAGRAAADGVDVVVQLEHLVSYQGMGRVRVECQAGCSCEPHIIDGHHVDGIRNTSVFVFTALAVHAFASPPPCQLQITVLNDSSSGLHKFKMRSLRVRATMK